MLFNKIFAIIKSKLIRYLLSRPYIGTVWTNWINFRLLDSIKLEVKLFIIDLFVIVKID